MAAPLPESFIDTPDAFDACCDTLRQESSIGFDTEFIGEQSYIPELCLVQISTPRNLFVVDPIALGDMKPLWNILQDHSKTIVVHAGREEARMARLATKKMPSHFFDLQLAAGLVGMTYPISYSGLVRETVKVKLDKSETLTDWARRPLSDRQLAYAYDDVRYLLPAHKKIERKLKKLGREDWLKEEWLKFCQKAVRDNTETERWRKLKGVNNLDRRRLAVAKEVYLWREERAASINRPARFLLRDDLIIEIAKRIPKTSHDVANLRGVTTRDVEPLLAAVRKAAELPEEKLPKKEKRDPDPGENAWVVQLFSATLGSLCKQHSVTQSLAATQTDLRQLLKSFSQRKTTGDRGLLHGWRREMFLPTLLGLWRGEQAMVLKPGRKGLSIECQRIAQPTLEVEIPGPTVAGDA